MRFTFFNGVETVGGVQILLTDEASSLQFDLGVVKNPAIAPRKVLFNDFVAPRQPGSVEDYLKAGMAPLVEGLFRPVAGARDPARVFTPLTVHLPLVTEAARGELAVFVSHMHDDHMALLPSVAGDVPVVLNDQTARMLELLVAADEVAPLAAPVRAVPDGEQVEVGALSCEPVPIDHDIPGAAGFVVRTPSGTVAYTGDWRCHGVDPELTERFAERCAQEQVDVLITEGSTLVPGDGRPQVSEAQLVERMTRAVGDSDGLVLVGFYARNLGRLLRIAAVAAACGRELAVQPGTGRWLELAAQRGLAQASELAGVVVVGDTTEAAGTSRFGVVTPDEVARERRHYLCETNPASWYQWLDLRVGPRDLYIHANGAPFGVADPVWTALRTWVAQLGPEFLVLDSHGHASPSDIEWLVKQVEPKAVIPVHTNHPELFPVGNYRLVLPQRGESVELSY